ncbi:MAG: methylenetetrahydrofolate--tRNA-(uracil(54)-C(5))-methyltransferase (FADH(2)-oxidizing) TrmFO [Deltaproteobacteria bacterium]|nr:methylenetetrahydrofolate--tRNA-(uracil(54)-C(5))-methyltransferase (FADH(2)-oxidizing) TrmFO [Deltaproteobacteria bacterium]MBI2975104.1 methylenetetrahydrofolate--tRNA-(uracil(54)-C(5))-methyltransferase (FADH(2)-oxidizing) TrmFO [Deltaproteobacteria bacterium]
MNNQSNKAIVIGAGLAGVEAAWQLAKLGIKVRLFEAKPRWFSPAHKSPNFAELVCSNSLKSEETGHATALLKEEMGKLGSVVIEAAHSMRLPAGKALAVDREGFAEYITEKISANKNIEIIRGEVQSLNNFGDDICGVIIATGPLSSPAFIKNFKDLLSDSGEFLYFHDAIAPIVEYDSIDMNIAFKASRYDVGKEADGDYINCPMTKSEYDSFIGEIIKANKVHAHEFDDIRYFEGCMPIEAFAERHPDALRHGPMKPMGIRHPKTGEGFYAIVQLRQDNMHATLYNIVGFQTRMTYPEQDRIFRMIPGLKSAKFARYGSMHRNTYINGPVLLNKTLQLKNYSHIYVAGQLTGVEGYLESAAVGLYAGLGLGYAIAKKSPMPAIPPTTAIGSLIRHITCCPNKNFQPMKIMWGIFPPLSEKDSTSRGPRKELRRKMILERAEKDFWEWAAGFNSF